MKINTFEQFPVLQTNRLELLEITQKHINDIFEIFSSAKVTEHYNCDVFSGREEAENLIELFQKRFTNKEGIRWGIKLKGESKISGTIGFNRVSLEKVAVLGYDLNEKYWNRGIISEAIQAVTNFGFEYLGLRKIEAEVIPENIASQIVLEKNGFKKEGVFPDKGFWKDKYHTLVLYSKSAELQAQ